MPRVPEFPKFLHPVKYLALSGVQVEFDTLRLRLLKIATRVVELKTQIRLHLPTACPDQAVLRAALGRLPRLVT